MPTALTQIGAYPLTGVGKLPNVDIAFPGEVWSNKRANGVIIPGMLVKPVIVGGVGCVEPIAEGDTVVDAGDGIRSQSLAIAMRQIMTPDQNPGSQYAPQLGPNEIVNLPIASNDYVRTLHSGVVNLTLVKPDLTYKEGDIIGYDPTATRPAGKAAGSGAWAKHASDDADVVAKTDLLVIDRPVRFYGNEGECILTCRFLRVNS